MSPKKFQVYGERCCGTNFIIKLLERNFIDIKFTEEFGFKHWFPERNLEISQDTLVVHITRDFTDSLQSLHRKPWHVAECLKDLPFGEFIRAEWECVWNNDFWGVTPENKLWGREMLHERNPQTNVRYPNVVAMKTAKDLYWSALRGRVKHFVNLDYDQVAQDPKATLEKLSDGFGISIAQNFISIENYKGSKTEKFKKTFYPEISFNDSEFIAEEIALEMKRTKAELVV